MNAIEETIVIKGLTWNIVMSGSGAPVVFLHNGGGNLWNWAHQLEHFSSRHRVIAADLPGFGRSQRPSGPLYLDDFVEGVAGLLKALDLDRPVLVGNCIGASIALEYALRQPEAVRALALFNLCGGIPMLTPGLRFWSGLRPRTPLGRALHRCLIEVAGHPFLRPLNARLIYANGEPSLHPALRQFLEEERRDPGLRPSLHPLVMGLDSFSVFSRPREKPDGFPPVLLGWGKQNRTLDVKWAAFIADWLAPDRLCLIEQAGHMAIYEQPGVVNESLKRFLESV